MLASALVKGGGEQVAARLMNWRDELLQFIRVLRSVSMKESNSKALFIERIVASSYLAGHLLVHL